MPPVVYLAIFFISGACGLAYEVVWTRLLGLSIGHTTVALTAVVAAYMGGLAAGSACIGRFLRRGIHPIVVYAVLEAAIAVLAVAFPVQLALVTRLSAESGHWLDRGSFALGAVRFGLAAIAVFPATFLMGGTLPAMLDAMPSRGAHAPARQAGWLYAVNTAGAVFGAALAGFVLIERLGTLETTWLAAAGNLLVAATALAGGRRSAEPDASDAAPAMPRRANTGAPQERVSRPGHPTREGDTGPARTGALPGVTTVLVAYGLSGFAALALQVVWTRALVFYAGSTTYAFTSMLIVFLTGITAGSGVAAPVVDRLRRPAGVFVLLQVLLAVSAAGSLRTLQAVSPGIDAIWPPELTWLSLVSGNFAKAAIAMTLPTLLMGMLFPVAVRLTQSPDTATAPPGTAAAVLGRLYAVNTLGGIAGAALTGLLLIPALGVRTTLFCACVTSLAAAALVGWGGERRRRDALLLPAVAVLAFGLATAGRPLHAPTGSETLVFYEEGASGTVSVLQEVTGTRTIYIDRVPVAGTDTIMLTDQKSLAHVPMLLNPAAKRVLTVGFGSGGASWSFTRHRSLDRVDAVEIDPTVFRAAPYLDDSNHGVWRDPRFHFILEDARNYLASTDVRYDVISTDCTDLRYKTNANLYTADYFALVRGRLTPGGIVTVWMPLGGLSAETFRMALRTFRQVFPHTTVWYMTNQPTHYLLLVATDHEIRPDVTAIAAAMTDTQVRLDLAAIRLDDPLKIASSLLLDEQEVARFVGDGPLNSDRHPLLEFQAPRLAYRDALAANLRATAAARDAGAGLRRWSGSAEVMSGLAPYVAATPALVEGHARYQLGTFDYSGALGLYRAAASVNPADRSIPPLIQDVERTRQVWLEEFASRTSQGSNEIRDWLSYATLLRQAGRLPAAIEAGRRATELAPDATEAWIRLAALHAQAGDATTALVTLERARQLAPRDGLLLSDLGAAYNELERFADAETVLRQSLALRPAADTHNNLGVALNGLGRPADAVRAFGGALALNSASAEAWFNLGVAHALLGDLQQARTAYQRGLALTPAEPRALFNLAMVEAQAGRLDLTARYLTEAIAHAPQSAQLHNELGRAYLGLQRIDDAVAALERARSLDPSSAAIAENLALARQSRPPSPAR